MLLCPSDYGDCVPVRHLLRDVLARHVFSPAIDRVTSPEYINGKILAYVRKNPSIRELSQKAFVYADSFEEFVALINESNDPAEVKQIR